MRGVWVRCAFVATSLVAVDLLFVAFALHERCLPQTFASTVHWSLMPPLLSFGLIMCRPRPSTLQIQGQGAL